MDRNRIFSLLKAILLSHKRSPTHPTVYLKNVYLKILKQHRHYYSLRIGTMTISISHLRQKICINHFSFLSLNSKNP